MQKKKALFVNTSKQEQCTFKKESNAADAGVPKYSRTVRRVRKYTGSSKLDKSMKEVVKCPP